MRGRKFDFVTSKIGDNLCWNVYVAFFRPYTVFRNKSVNFAAKNKINNIFKIGMNRAF
jgi:hypothetical protein